MSRARVGAGRPAGIEPIAVIGIALRLPGAQDPAALWQILSEGQDQIGEAPASRRADLLPADGRADAPWLRGGFLPDVRAFDASRFGISPAEARWMDPQQRLMLELGWAVLQDAGIDPDEAPADTAVLVGSASADYALLAGAGTAASSFAFPGLSRTMIANRLSHVLGLTGPSLTVDTGQSSSLVALHLACESLRRQECRLALVGGVHLNLAAAPARMGELAGVLSPSARCFTFDARADGFARGEGAVMVALKPLAAALDDGDDVHCLIRGSAVNNDGPAESLVGPQAQAQAQVVRAAHRQAGVQPADIGYLELHGTGTRRGDEIEATGLGQVFAGRGPAAVPVGSVKTNFGHLEAAAGLLGLVKTALALRHEILPASLNFDRAAPGIPLHQLGLRVLTEAEPWPGGAERLAGVSAFGIGGTNCHVVLGATPAGACGGERPGRPVRPFQRKDFWFDDAVNGPRSRGRAAGSEPELLALVLATTAQLLGRTSVEEISPATNFADLGIDSLSALELHRVLTEATGVTPSRTLVFDHPTPLAAARHLGHLLAAAPVPARAELTAELTADLTADLTAELQPARLATGPGAGEPIAVVSMACRYPGDITGPEDLWAVVAAGTDVIGPMVQGRGWSPDDVFNPAGGEHRSYVREGGFLSGAEDFDPAFFGISPREALGMDPQQRLMLEVGWETMRRAGLDPAGLAGSLTGVYVGAMPSSYSGTGAPAADAASGYQLTGGAPSVISGRMAYAFGLEGPAVTVDTACSSSSVAIHLAVQALRAGECDLALAGGVTVMSDPGMFVDFSAQRGLSPDGRCKSFSDSADGTGWSEGVGLLMLQPLSAARRSGHPVLALITGSAVNQDGASNGLTAPNGPAQERVIRRALRSAGLSPTDVDAVEAHGTGTRLGDPIEAQALLATYGQRPVERPLWLGSVKSNIGHTQAAAGVGGVIKMIMALRHQQLPATLHADRPSTDVDWSTGNVRLLTAPQPWPVTERRRRAGVSSFGISGTNAHLILEEAPPAPTRPARPVRSRTAFLFAGQGSQRPGMGRALAGRIPVFGRSLREICEELDPLLGSSLERVMFATDPPSALLDRTDHTQPALFAYELAMFRMLWDDGSRPDVLLGHSVGEIVAACAAGVLSLADACRLVVTRGRLMHDAAGSGAMVSVAADEAEVRAAILRSRTNEVSIAAVNGPAAVVFAGAADEVRLLTGLLRAAGRRCTPLRVSHAFHSPLMEPILAPLGQVAASLTYRPAQIPIISTVTGLPVDDATLGSADHWVRQVRRPVRFQDAVASAFEQGVRTFVEIGPATTLTGLTRAVLNHRDRPAEPAAAPACVSTGTASTSSPDGSAEVAAVRRVTELTSGVSTPDAGPVPLPFRRQRFWRPPAIGRSAVVDHSGVDRSEHPLIGGLIEHAGSRDLTLSLSLTQANHGWLFDHALLGTPVLPATAFVELVHQAGKLRGLPEIGELVQERPLRLDPARPVQLQVRLTVQSAQDRGGIEVFGRSPGEDDWTRYASGDVRRSTPAPRSPTRPGACTGSAPSAGTAAAICTAAATAPGAPVRGGLAAFGFGHDGLFAGLDRSADGPAGREHFAVHPAQFDCAVQTAVLDHLRGHDPAGSLLLPWSWRGVRIQQPGATVARVESGPVRQRASVGDRPGTASWIRLLDRAGEPVATVDELVLRAVSRSGLRARLDGLLDDILTMSWQPVDGDDPHADTDQGSGLGLLGRDQVALRSACLSAGLPLQPVADLLALDTLADRRTLPPHLILTVGAQDEARDVHRETERALIAVRSWVTDDRLLGSTLVLVAGGSPSAGDGRSGPGPAVAAVWGLVRAAAAEVPGRVRLVDFGPGPLDPGLLRAALRRDEFELAVRDGRLTRPVLVTTPREVPASPRIAPSPSGTVLITGGTGALGLLIADHLVRRHGVRQLLLVSRRGRFAGGVDDATTRWAGLGVTTTVTAADVSDRAQLRQVLDAVPAEHPLTMVVHAAGVLGDRTVTGLDPAQLHGVLRPKVDAALLLDELTEGLDLAGFVMFSSVTGVIGGAGQAAYSAANAALNAIAERRTRQGRPTLSLAWGLWEEGMGAALDEVDVARWRRLGIEAMPAEAALAAFDTALGLGVATVVPLRRTPTGPGGSALSGGTRRGSGDRRAELRPDSVSGWVALVVDTAAEVLGLPDGKHLAADGELWSSGLDSLTAWELHSRLSKATGLPLGAAAIFDFPVPTNLASHLQELGRSGAADDLTGVGQATTETEEQDRRSGGDLSAF